MVMDDDDVLKFCWDDTKATANVDKHGVSFEMAAYVFDDPMRLEEADLFAEGEYRSIVVGRVGKMLLTVVYAPLEDDIYRIISARPATPYEYPRYAQNLFHS